MESFLLTWSQNLYLVVFEKGLSRLSLELAAGPFGNFSDHRT